MHLIADICVIPLGVGLSASKYVAACERIFQDAGLTHQLHSYGTNVEGDWDEVMGALKRCHEVVHEMGAVRISTTVRLGTRNDREQTMQDKLDSVARELEE